MKFAGQQKTARGRVLRILSYIFIFCMFFSHLMYINRTISNFAWINMHMLVPVQKLNSLGRARGQGFCITLKRFE